MIKRDWFHTLSQYDTKNYTNLYLWSLIFALVFFNWVVGIIAIVVIVLGNLMLVGKKDEIFKKYKNIIKRELAADKKPYVFWIGHEIKDGWIESFACFDSSLSPIPLTYTDDVCILFLSLKEKEKLENYVDTELSKIDTNIPNIYYNVKETHLALEYSPETICAIFDVIQYENLYKNLDYISSLSKKKAETKTTSKKKKHN